MKRNQVVVLLLLVLGLPLACRAQFHYVGGSFGLVPGIHGQENETFDGRSPVAFYIPVAFSYHFQFSQALGVGLEAGLIPVTAVSQDWQGSVGLGDYSVTVYQKFRNRFWVSPHFRFWAGEHFFIEAGVDGGLAYEEFRAGRVAYSSPVSQISGFDFQHEQSYPFAGFHLALGGNWNMGAHGYGNASFTFTYFKYMPETAIYLPNVSDSGLSTTFLGAARNFIGVGLRMGFGWKK